MIVFIYMSDYIHIHHNNTYNHYQINYITYILSLIILSYIYIDITKANYTANVQIQEYLIARIKKDNYNIKYKCLVIIKVRSLLLSISIC